jgi:serine/threonine protein kinase
LVTGKAPFPRDTVVKTILAHREAPIPKILFEGNEANSEALNGLFQKMVAKNPDERFQSAPQLIQEVERIRDTLNASAGDQTPQTDQTPSSQIDLPTMPSHDSDQAKLLLHNERFEIVSPISFRPSSGSEFLQSPPEEPISKRPANLSDAAPATASGQAGPVVQDSSGPVNPPSASLAVVAANEVMSDAEDLHYISDFDAALRQGSNPNAIGILPNRGGGLLTLGVFSLLLTFCFVGIVLGVVTWIYANSDLQEMQAGLRDPQGKNSTKAAKVLGMIACLAGIFMWILAPTIRYFI